MVNNTVINYQHSARCEQSVMRFCPCLSLLDGHSLGTEGTSTSVPWETVMGVIFGVVAVLSLAIILFKTQIINW